MQINESTWSGFTLDEDEFNAVAPATPEASFVRGLQCITQAALKVDLLPRSEIIRLLRVEADRIVSEASPSPNLTGILL